MQAHRLPSAPIHVPALRNPATPLQSAKIKQTPTMPLTEDEYEAVLEASTSDRITMTIELLRHSGLRISDAATLERSRLQEDRLLLYTAKSGTPVHMPLPPELASDLRASRLQFYKLPGSAVSPCSTRSTYFGSAAKTCDRVLRSNESASCETSFRNNHWQCCYRLACEQDLEGIVAKLKDGSYGEGWGLRSAISATRSTRDGESCSRRNEPWAHVRVVCSST
jgi:hypothetical protein